MENLAVLAQNYDEAAKFGLKDVFEYVINDVAAAEDVDKYKVQIKREAEFRLFNVEWS